jgi:hypothetical protein
MVALYPRIAVGVCPTAVGAGTVRNRQGTLITPANGEIRLVQNLSKDWARHQLYIYLHLLITST